MCQLEVDGSIGTGSILRGLEEKSEWKLVSETSVSHDFPTFRALQLPAAGRKKGG
jgi:hypothetical protein